MSAFYHVTVAMALIASFTNATSEDIYWGPGKIHVVPWDKKISQSFGYARLVVEGRFRLLNVSPVIEKYSDGEAFLLIDFLVDRVLKGGKVDDSNRIALKVPILVGDASRAKISQKISLKELDLARLKNEQFEKDSGGKVLDKKNYDGAMGSLKSEMLRSDKYLRSFVLVPIKVGGDSPYRETIASLIFDKKYVLFLLKDPKGEPVSSFFPWELDLYRSEKDVLDILDRQS